MAQPSLLVAASFLGSGVTEDWEEEMVTLPPSPHHTNQNWILESLAATSA